MRFNLYVHFARDTHTTHAHWPIIREGRNYAIGTIHANAASLDAGQIGAAIRAAYKQCSGGQIDLIHVQEEPGEEIDEPSYGEPIYGDATYSG